MRGSWIPGTVFSRNSEVETTWISLIGWHHETSTVQWWIAKSILTSKQIAYIIRFSFDKAVIFYYNPFFSNFFQFVLFSTMVAHFLMTLCHPYMKDSEKMLKERLILLLKMNLASNVHATIVILLPRGSFRYIFNFNCFRVQTDPPMLSGSDLPSTICAGPVEPGLRARGQFDPPNPP